MRAPLITRKVRGAHELLYLVGKSACNVSVAVALSVSLLLLAYTLRRPLSSVSTRSDAANSTAALAPTFVSARELGTDYRLGDLAAEQEPFNSADFDCTVQLKGNPGNGTRAGIAGRVQLVKGRFSALMKKWRMKQRFQRLGHQLSYQAKEESADLKKSMGILGDKAEKTGEYVGDEINKGLGGFGVGWSKVKPAPAPVAAPAAGQGKGGGMPMGMGGMDPSMGMGMGMPMGMPMGMR